MMEKGAQQADLQTQMRWWSNRVLYSKKLRTANPKGLWGERSSLSSYTLAAHFQLHWNTLEHYTYLTMQISVKQHQGTGESVNCI